MRLDNYNNKIFNDLDLFQALYSGLDLSSVSDNLIVDKNQEIINLEDISGIKFKSFSEVSDSLSVEDHDKKNQSVWYMPQEYANLDIKEYCLSCCLSENERERVLEEFDEFRKRDMIPVLQWMKYFVDTCLEKDILWGLGRGSSVSSYILFLLGVHAIDSLKYNLDWREYLR